MTTDAIPKKRTPVKRWIVLALFVIGGYAAFGSNGVLKPISPVVVLPAEPTGIYIAGFPITNTILATLIADVVLILFAFGAYRFSKSGKQVPSGMYNFFELLVEFLWNSVKGSAGKWATRIFPVVATIFLLVLAANMTKLFPGYEAIGYMKEIHEGKTGYAPVKLFDLGSIPVYGLDKDHPIIGAAHGEEHGEGEAAAAGGEAHGEESAGAKEMCTACEVVPFLRGSATDLNFPFALAVITVLLTQVYGVWALGPSYFSKYLPVGQLINGGIFGLINFGVGFLEIILEFAKILSFGFRLFGNIFAGTLLLSIVGALTAIVVPPFLYLFEVFFGAIQAYVFFLLATVFISGATVSHHAEEHH